MTVPRGDAGQGLGEQVCILGERLELEISLEKMAFKALGLDCPAPGQGPGEGEGRGQRGASVSTVQGDQEPAGESGK